MKRPPTDATRPRRTKDEARQRWYGHWRTLRWAHHYMGRPITGEDILKVLAR